MRSHSSDNIVNMNITDVTKLVHVFGYLINSPGAEVRGQVTKGSILHRVDKIDVSLEEFTDGRLEVLVVKVRGVVVLSENVTAAAHITTHSLQSHIPSSQSVCC